MVRWKRKSSAKRASLVEAILFLALKWWIGIVILLTFIGEVLSALFSFFSSLDILGWLYAALTAGILYFLYYLTIVRERNAKEARMQQKQSQLLVSKRKQRERMREKNSLEQLKKMDPFEFEYFTKQLFELMGYNAEVTSRSNDGGKDVVLLKDNEKSIVECKRFNSPKVTRPDIQKFHSALMDTGSVKGYFITTGEFTKPAIEYCQNKPIELINGENLVKMVHDALGSVESDAAIELSIQLEPKLT